MPDSLNDPESYEHIKTTYKDFNDFIIVNATFAAKNGFGALKKDVIV